MEYNTDKHYINVNDINLHVLTAGDGFPLVLLHGFPQTSYVWRKIIPRLAPYFKIIAPDLRGMGDSSITHKGQDKKTLASDIKALCDYFDFKKIIIAGHDWGGAVAQRFNIDYPELTECLISIAIPYMPTAKIEELTRTEQIFDNWYFFFHQIPSLPERFVEMAGKDYLLWMFKRGAGKNGNPLDDNDLNEYLRTFSPPERSSAAFNLYRTLFTTDARDWGPYRTKMIDTPTIWIRGDKDPFVPPSMSANISSHFSNIHIEELVNCGHWIPEERPEELSSIIYEKLKYLNINK